jgi:hypothetical protein
LVAQSGSLPGYLRSFADANDDGVGDIAGLISRLPYIKELGVDAVWISPWYVIADARRRLRRQNYVDTDPLFGSLEDVQTLIDASHDWAPGRSRHGRESLFESAPLVPIGTELSRGFQGT